MKTRWDLEDTIRLHILKCVAAFPTKEEAAKALGVSRATINRKLSEYGYFDKPASRFEPDGDEPKPDPLPRSLSKEPGDWRSE